MTVKVRRGGSPDSYLKLVRQFPLRPLRTESELDQAIKVVDWLLDRDGLDEGAQDYLEVLGDLIEKYETEHHPMPPVSDAEMLSHLIDMRNVSQSEVAKATRIAVSTISEILAGKRKLNLRHIGKLAAYFGVNPAVFVSTGE